MTGKQKVIYCTLCLFAAFSYMGGIVHAQESAKAEKPIFTPPVKDTSMKQMTFKRPEKTEKREKEAVAADDPKEIDIDKELGEESASEDESADTQNLTPGQKLWKKYKDLADAAKKDDDNKEPAEEKEVKEPTPEEIEEAEAKAQEDKKKEEKKTKFQGILDKYKNAQKEKGVLNSRSFGDPNR